MRRYEDFAVGDAYRSALARTVTETDNLLFTMLAMNTNELHFNEEAARATEWGKPLVNSTFTLALVLGLSVADDTQAGGVSLTGPRSGSPTRSSSATHSIRSGDHGAPQQRPDRYGAVSRCGRAIISEVVCEFDRSFLIPRREGVSRLTYRPIEHADLDICELHGRRGRDAIPDRRPHTPASRRLCSTAGRPEQW
jgi:hypothetical protein